MLTTLLFTPKQVVVSAPVQDKSGTGSSDAPATDLTVAGEFNSVPAGSPATGSDNNVRCTSKK